MRRTNTLRGASGLAALILVLTGCSNSPTSSSESEGSENLPTGPPTSINRVPITGLRVKAFGGEAAARATADPRRLPTGFSRPGDGVASPDGSIFYFTGFTEAAEPEGAVFSVPSAGGMAEVLYSGPPLDNPTGLVLSCDGSILYVAAAPVDEGAGGRIHALDLDTGELTPIQADGIGDARGLAMYPDCVTIAVTGFSGSATGRNEGPSAGLFSVPVGGGTASERYSGHPLITPAGIHVDVDDVAWVMDQFATGDDGPGVLFAVSMDGTIEPVLSGLRMGAPGGVSLAAGGVTAVIPEVDELGIARLAMVSTETGERTQLPAPDMVGPAGIRTAREAGVFIVVDNEGGAIFRAE